MVTRRITRTTRGDGDVVDITREVQREVDASGLRAGIATLFVTGSTAALTVIEAEEGLLEDFARALERLAPRELPYAHNRADDNGHSHVRASVLGPSLVVPFVQGRLTLGAWQAIALADFDTRPRTREVVVQVMGE